MLVLAGFTTLFLIGLILADARLQTRSLWLPIGLHAGWILASGAFNKIAHREIRGVAVARQKFAHWNRAAVRLSRQLGLAQSLVEVCRPREN